MDVFFGCVSVVLYDCYKAAVRGPKGQRKDMAVLISVECVVGSCLSLQLFCVYSMQVVGCIEGELCFMSWRQKGESVVSRFRKVNRALFAQPIIASSDVKEVGNDMNRVLVYHQFKSLDIWWCGVCFPADAEVGNRVSQSVECGAVHRRDVRDTCTWRCCLA